MKLFRDEMTNAQAAQWLGTVRLVRPLSFSLVTTAVVIALCLSIAFAMTGEITRKARLNGVLVPTAGSINVTAPQNAIVLERRVSEGQQVKTGDVLFVLRIDHQSMMDLVVEDNSMAIAHEIQRRRELVSNARKLSARRALQQKNVVLEKLRSVEAELTQADEEIRLQQRRIELGQQSIDRLTPLTQEGYIPESRLQEKQEAQLEALNKLQATTRSRSGLIRDRESLRGEVDSIVAQLAADQNALDTQESTLRQDAVENKARSNVVVTAPCEGTISGIEIKAGQAVQAAQTLVTMLPESGKGKRLEAHLFAPSRTVGFVQRGQPVYIRYAAYPFQKFGMYSGKIAAISETPFSPNELPPNLAQQLVAQTGSVEALYRISVELDDQAISAYGQALPLKPGFTLEADVVQARLKIWEVIFEPLLAVSARTF